MQIATNDSMFPVMAAIKWIRTYFAMLATPLTVDDVLIQDTPPLVTLECLIDAAVTLQLANGNLRAVYQQEFRLLDDADRRVMLRRIGVDDIDALDRAFPGEADNSGAVAGGYTPSDREQTESFRRGTCGTG